ncbi:MAG: G-D-S-L family lipolytic protein [Flavobacteriaceae bacterium]
MKKIKYLWLLPLFAGLTACDVNNTIDEVPEATVIEIPLSTGSADFSKFVAVGNSLTAGYADGSLFQAGQVNSFPNIMSQMMANGGGGTFMQPMMNDNIGGLLIGGARYPDGAFGPRLYFNGAGPALLPGNPTTETTNILSGSFNNMGVPGAKSFHLLAPGYGNVANISAGLANPYFVRFASSPNATVIGDAMAQSPTFFSLWIGNNDVLGYATSGGDGSDPITDPTVFAQAYTALISTLTSGGAKGVVANIPDVTSIPYFTTVPYNPVPMDAATSGALNAQLLGPVIQILTLYGQPNRLSLLEASSNNPLMIVDETLLNLSAEISGALQAGGVPLAQAELMGNLYGRARHATSADLITLPSSSLIGTTEPGIPAPFNTRGVTFPFQDKNVLIPSEQMAISDATTLYNNTILSLASANGLAHFDANGLMTQLSTTGLEFDNFTVTSNLVFGGAFSLDGVHLTARGYAFVANKMFDAIDLTYGSNFKESNNVAKAVNYPTNFPPGI